jgi:hypothetical protein
MVLADLAAILALRNKAPIRSWRNSGRLFCMASSTGVHRAVAGVWGCVFVECSDTNAQSQLRLLFAQISYLSAGGISQTFVHFAWGIRNPVWHFCCGPANGQGEQHGYRDWWARFSVVPGCPLTRGGRLDLPEKKSQAYVRGMV